MYLNDFQTDNMQFLSETAALKPNQRVVFHPAGREYDKYILVCYKLYGCTFVYLSKGDANENLGMFALEKKDFPERLSVALLNRGITRVIYKKVGEAL